MLTKNQTQKQNTPQNKRDAVAYNIQIRVYMRII